MPETVIPGPVGNNAAFREAACIHTRKIYDSCQAKDCIEDLRVYPVESSQPALESAQFVKAGRAELLYVSAQVDPVGLNRGFYSVDLRFFYRVWADTYAAACARPVPVTGLAVFQKRCMLFGSQGFAKIFTSRHACPEEEDLLYEVNLPEAIVEAVDPLVLSVKLACGCHPCGEGPLPEIPPAILELFDEPLVFTPTGPNRLLITLGQFSILRMERDSQLLIPVYDYCMPHKECPCDGPCEEDPCQLFQRVDFPVGEFFPPSVTKESEGAERMSCCCGK